MAAMGRKEEVVAFAEFPILSLAVNAETGAARDHEHPFVAVLIVPVAVRRGLAETIRSMRTPGRS